jgi:hypothetical protein
VGLTAKQEKFAQAVADGMTHVEAYRAHYTWKTMLPTTVVECASRVAHSHKVAARIAELKAQDAHELAVARVWNKVRFVEEAEHNLTQSRDLGQMAPANKSLELIGRVTGVLAEQATPTDTPKQIVIVLNGVPNEQGIKESVIEGEARTLNDVDSDPS